MTIPAVDPSRPVRREFADIGVWREIFARRSSRPADLPPWCLRDSVQHRAGNRYAARPSRRVPRRRAWPGPLCLRAPPPRRATRCYTAATGRVHAASCAGGRRRRRPADPRRKRTGSPVADADAGRRRPVWGDRRARSVGTGAGPITLALSEQAGVCEVLASNGGFPGDSRPWTRPPGSPGERPADAG